MASFIFEKDLPHQVLGVNSVLSVFDGADVSTGDDPTTRLLANPKIILSDVAYKKNLKAIHEFNGIEPSAEFLDVKSNVIDVSMETGTGKTYTYAKTICELNKSFGLNKFIVIVPTLSIKAGTVNVLKGDGLKDRFKSDYNGREIKTYVVESQSKGKKQSKDFIPQSIYDFVNANSVNQKYIHVLVINSGMINSDSIQTKTYDSGLFDSRFNRAIDALKATNPIVIVDEPHKFPKAKVTWKNIENIGAQYIIRYGATFNNDFYNLVYRLTAIDAFNDDLVKGVKVFIEEMEGEDSARLTLKSLSKEEAVFELNESGRKRSIPLRKGESLSAAHSAIHDLYVEALSVSMVVLSNGVELKVGKSINPYSYVASLEDSMMRKAIKEHFKLERELLTQSPRIKPLTLFFIDDIEGYRDGNELSGSLKTKFEEWVLAEANERLKTEKNVFYKEYLEKTIRDISLVHGGYFSRDNIGKDEKIEKEINDILHDKESLLSLDNPRRFVFSKWTLKEGWDNPNVFQICKLRSSGSTTSKLQEVGRGLRLPVNEYMARVKDQPFFLNYFVDFTEKDFVKTLISDVNESAFEEVIPTTLTPELKDKIRSAYPDVSALGLMMELVKKGIINENEEFIGDGYQSLKSVYPDAFQKGLKDGKVTHATDNKGTTRMRVGEFTKLRELWECINHKAILEYKIAGEDAFLELFTSYLKKEIAANSFKRTGVRTRVEKLKIHDGHAVAVGEADEDDDFEKFSTMTYKDFLERLSQLAFIKLSTLHRAFISVKKELVITDYLNIQTIRKIKAGFSHFLLHNAFTKFELGYKQMSRLCSSKQIY
ncbi:type III restriction-modification system endonuclease [Marinomonas sp. GJ51-6]|uniref:type III restriction-modification system endonuclease n=1 Tax=Marinomonas sp. GJ51-6 TaxID=2992802 RepID=UPI0029348D96|nr:type III restriction-modification system endonuclease [Marinomonas sp. GJ51-6]WOD09199.1 type III restriction-modification system endonuclease [Marinomonas sp. GJ51-6]